MNFPQIQFGLRLLASPPGAGNTDFQVCAPNRLLACFTSAGYKPAGRTGRNACVSIRRTGALCESLPFQPYHPLKTANTNENRNHHPNCRYLVSADGVQPATNSAAGATQSTARASPSGAAAGS